MKSLEVKRLMDEVKLWKRKAQLDRADVYVRFAAAYLRKLGWGVEPLERGSLNSPDPGDLRIDRNGREEIVDVKEAAQWVERWGRKHDWLEWPVVGLTSDDQFHPEWIYLVVAHDFHAMTFVNPSELPDEAYSVTTNTNKQTGEPYKWIRVKKEYTKPYSVHVSARPIK